MYYVQIESSFESAHFLREYQGKCKAIHGHNFKILVELKSDKLDRLGMVEDFVKMEEKLQRLTEKLDHKLLNDIEPFDKINPTSERLSEYIYYELQKQYKTIKVNKVTVYENDRYAATYKEE